jgi:hypothetical protein
MNNSIDVIRKLISFVLLIALIIQSFGCLIIFKATKFYIRQQSKYYLSVVLQSNQLEILAIPVKDMQSSVKVFERIESWEICYKGQMFDLLREEAHNDTVFFFGFYDMKENALNRISHFHATLLSEFQHEMKLKAIEFFGLISSLWYFEKSNLQFFQPVIRIFFIEIPDIFTSFLLNILTPPPKI